jgi:methionyl-tRNA formyltransferase
VKLAAQELGLPVWQPQTLKGQAAASELAGAELILVMAYGELLRRELLDPPRYGCINLHASLLPRWRGASPLQAALRAGDARTGVTVMRMVPALDAGPIYCAEEIPLTERTTLPELHDLVAQAAARAVVRFLDQSLGREPVAQDEALVTVCRKLESVDGRLDFNLPAIALERWVRAYTPAPGCWAMAGDDRWRILELEPVGDRGPLAPGELFAQDDTLLVGCGDGVCAIRRLQVPGGKPLGAAEFLRGHSPPARLG